MNDSAMFTLTESGRSLLVACFAMVGLSFVVWVMQFAYRLSEMKGRRVAPQQIATSVQMGQKLQNTKAADNFRNLFELPVLFYLLCMLAMTLKVQSSGLVAGAWLFVTLRVLHSFIHCTYNKVMHRFYAYLASSVVLFGLWVMFAILVF